mgnify:CR=1 FL=1
MPNYFCNLLKNFWLALILIRTAGTLFMQKGNGTLIALFHIRTAFGCMTGWTSEDFCSFFVECKISKDIQSRFPCQACGNQFYVFIICKLRVSCSAVCSIRNDNSPFFLFIHLLKMLPDKLAVAMVVLLRVIYHQRSTGADERMKQLLTDADKLAALCESGYNDSTEYDLFVRCLSEQTIVENENRRLRTKEDGGMKSSMMQCWIRSSWNPYV